MNLRSIVAAAAVVLLAVACRPQEEATNVGGTWVGTITTEGTVTTVVNESGSVWGGTARLVEEASIGVESGADEYMFGRINSVGATPDRIYVLDVQASLVRVYDNEGGHLFDFGGDGVGPGELRSSVVMGVDPGGRVLVQTLDRVNVLDLDGRPLVTWPIPGGLVRAIVVTPAGTAFVPNPRRSNVVPVNPDGTVGEPLAPSERRGSADSTDWSLMATSSGRTRYASVPFATLFRWEILPSGAIVEGHPSGYSFSLRRPDGSALDVSRSIALPAVSVAERQWRRKLQVAEMRQIDPEWTWDGESIPATRPAFERFHGDRFGRIWIWRNLGGEQATNCTEDPEPASLPNIEPCWRDVFGYDVFDESTGRLLGEVRLPDEVNTFRQPAFQEEALIAIFTDEAGTIMVKRYRLVLPGER